MVNNLIPWTICYHSWTALNREKTVSACWAPTDRRPNWPERAEQHRRASQSRLEKEVSRLKFSGQAHNDWDPVPASLSSICSPFFAFRSQTSKTQNNNTQYRAQESEKRKILETKAKPRKPRSQRSAYVNPQAPLFSLSPSWESLEWERLKWGFSKSGIEHEHQDRQTDRQRDKNEFQWGCLYLHRNVKRLGLWDLKRVMRLTKCQREGLGRGRMRWSCCSSSSSRPPWKRERERSRDVCGIFEDFDLLCLLCFCFALLRFWWVVKGHK